MLSKEANKNAFFVMPDAWKPGENIKMPDPSDPTKFIEIPADAIEVVAEQPA